MNKPYRRPSGLLCIILNIFFFLGFCPYMVQFKWYELLKLNGLKRPWYVKGLDAKSKTTYDFLLMITSNGSYVPICCNRLSFQGPRSWYQGKILIILCQWLLITILLTGPVPEIQTIENCVIFENGYNTISNLYIEH